MQPKKNTKRQTRGPTGLYDLFLLTVPIEEVAFCQYKTVQITFFSLYFTSYYFILYYSVRFHFK